MRQLIHTYVAYNLWANKRIAAIINKVDKSLYDKEVKSSFPSLRKTVHHIWDAELIWTSRLKGEKINWPPTAQIVNPQIDDFVKASEEFASYILSLDENFLDSGFQYVDSRGVQHQNKKWEMIMHCVNHSSYHRGQIITILRELGLTEAISTDLIAYLREQK